METGIGKHDLNSFTSRHCSVVPVFLDGCFVELASPLHSACSGIGAAPIFCSSAVIQITLCLLSVVSLMSCSFSTRSQFCGFEDVHQASNRGYVAIRTNTHTPGQFHVTFSLEWLPYACFITHTHTRSPCLLPYPPLLFRLANTPVWMWMIVSVVSWLPLRPRLSWGR